jgi:hypothetical protein
MELVGYKLIDANDELIDQWGGTWGLLPGRPEPLILPNGDRVHCPELKVRLADGYMLIPWEEAAPVASPSDTPLPDRQLQIGLLVAGYDLAVVDAAIGAIADPIDRAIARVWWDRTTVIQWDHPMTQTLMGLAGIPENERATLWIWASDLAA